MVLLLLPGFLPASFRFSAFFLLWVSCSTSKFLFPEIPPLFEVTSLRMLGPTIGLASSVLPALIGRSSLGLPVGLFGSHTVLSSPHRPLLVVLCMQSVCC